MVNPEGESGRRGFWSTVQDVLGQAVDKIGVCDCLKTHRESGMFIISGEQDPEYIYPLLTAAA
jgi:hypothetical protein